MSSLRLNGRRVSRSRRRGQSLVEFAAALPFLAILVFGIIEFGFFVRDSLIISNAARDGARAAAVGKTTTDITTRITNSSSPLATSGDNGSITLEYSTNNGTSYTTLSNTTEATASLQRNTAPAGSLVRVTVATNHKPFVFLFGPIFRRTVSTAVVMRREAS
jgi:Flp pilus assembly protein TadG